MSQYPTQRKSRTQVWLTEVFQLFPLYITVFHDHSEDTNVCFAFFLETFSFPVFVQNIYSALKSVLKETATLGKSG